MTECSLNTPDHNLDLSLGSSTSKQKGRESNPSQTATPFEADWRNQGFRPKVNRAELFLYSYSDAFLTTQLSLKSGGLLFFSFFSLPKYQTLPYVKLPTL